MEHCTTMVCNKHRLLRITHYSAQSFLLCASLSSIFTSQCYWLQTVCPTFPNVHRDHHFLRLQAFEGIKPSRHLYRFSNASSVLHMHMCLLFGRALYRRPYCRHISPQALSCVPLPHLSSTLCYAAIISATPKKTHPDTPGTDSILTSTASYCSVTACRNYPHLSLHLI